MLDYEKAIRETIEKKEITYEELEERSGYSARSICDIANGRIKQPYFFTVEAIVEALGLRLQITEAES